MIAVEVVVVLAMIAVVVVGILGRWWHHCCECEGRRQSKAKLLLWW